MTLPEFKQEELTAITSVFMTKLIVYRKRNEPFDQITDTDTFRSEIAESYPELAKAFERASLEELRAVSNDVALAEAIAYTIRWTLKLYKFA